MDNFKRICGLILSNPDLYDRRMSHLEKTMEQLGHSNVPVSDDPCRTCADPCELGHSDYPSRFDVDLTSEMLGSVKPYQRQIVISTGKSDWHREVTEEEGSLAQYISNTSKRHRKPSFSAGTSGTPKPKRSDATAPGVFSSSDASRLSVLNGSHRTVSCDDDMETVLVFPDYKFVRDVRRSAEGADELWRAALDPGVSQVGKTGVGDVKSWPLPYACVILLCSHKKRDNRCHIASSKLEAALTHALETEGYEVHTQLDDAESDRLPALEDIPGTDAERAAELQRRLETIADAPKRALVLKNSHIGGHKYSGNVVIYTPQGSGVWYGRVTPHEVPALVKATICEGRVLPALLRGGVNLTRPVGKDLLSW